MQTIGQLAQGQMEQKQRMPPSSVKCNETMPTASTKMKIPKIIHELFLALSIKYESKFTAKYPDKASRESAKAVWARDLVDIGPAQINYALDLVVRMHPAWPPTVGEFRQLCLVDAQELGLPTVETAWLEVASLKMRERPGQPIYSHGVVMAAKHDPAVLPHVYDWAKLPGDRGLRKFKPHYDRYIARALAGEVFKLPTVLEDKTGVPLTPEEKAAARERSKQIAAESFATMLTTVGWK